MIETWKLQLVFLGHSDHPINFSPSIRYNLFRKGHCKPKFSIKPTFGLHSKSAISVIQWTCLRASWGPYPSPTDYGRPVRKSPSLHGRKSNPNPKFIGTAEAYFVCHIGPKVYLKKSLIKSSENNYIFYLHFTWLCDLWDSKGILKK